MGLGNCQMPDLQAIAEGEADMPTPSLSRRLKLALRRHLPPRQERALKICSNNMIDRFYRWIGRNQSPVVQVSQASSAMLKAGDLVRVRSKSEIEATLNHWGQLRGCKFMPELAQYCGPTQRVLKSMERFVDERDLRVKKCKGIILLEGVHCEGTTDFGRCDRSCFLFWREE
jgi:hypothetical protein